MAVVEDQEVEGGIVINPASALGKELAKWEQYPTAYARRPGNPYQYRPYPKMVYRAVQKPNGKVVCMEGPPPMHWFKDATEYQQAVLQADALEKQCFTTVHDEGEWLKAKGQGWCESPQAAIDQFEREQQVIANAAAEANHAAQRMSPKAQAERKRREDATHEHVPE